MPDMLDDLFGTLSTDVASRTSAPGARAAITSSRRRSAGLATAATVAVLAVGLTLILGDGGRPDDRQTPASSTTPPMLGLDVDDVPVWYDSRGLHRGEVTEQTAVPLFGRPDAPGARLSLVRTGALYLDVVRRQVWFHPWGGEPRVLGRDAPYGAVGDPEGDTAAWFEGAELVVFDTAEAREIARVTTDPVSPSESLEHVDHGNGIRAVSAESVVWTTTDARSVLRLDLGTRRVVTESSSLGRTATTPALADAYDATELLGWGHPDLEGALILRRPGLEDRPLPDFEPAGRLSPNGRYLLGVTRQPHGTAFVDIQSGEPFTLPERAPDFSPRIGWSYGSSALIVLDENGDAGSDSLLGCDAERRTCAELPSTGEVLLPWS